MRAAPPAAIRTAPVSRKGLHESGAFLRLCVRQGRQARPQLGRKAPLERQRNHSQKLAAKLLGDKRQERIAA